MNKIISKNILLKTIKNFIITYLVLIFLILVNSIFEKKLIIFYYNQPLIALEIIFNNIIIYCIMLFPIVIFISTALLIINLIKTNIIYQIF